MMINNSGMWPQPEGPEFRTLLDNSGQVPYYQDPQQALLQQFLSAVFRSYRQ